MKPQIHLSIALLFGIFCNTFGQDYHFSQFDANPFYVNPALTGERMNQDYTGIQVNAGYREQTAKYTKSPGSYRSLAAGIDEPINSKFSAGQFLYNNKSVTGSFNTFGLMLSGAYKIIDQTVDKGGNHNLSIGIQLGLFNRSVRPENFTYDAQYSTSSPDGFDMSIPSGESFARESYYKFNINYGVYYRGTSKNKRLIGFGGFAIYNLTKANESFSGTYSALPLRINFHGGIYYSATKQLSIMPQILYMSQAKASELNATMLLFYKLDEKSMYEPILGFGFRNKEAIIFQLGLRHKGIMCRVSYDVITNYTKFYRKRGLELSLVYTMSKKPASVKEKNQSSQEPQQSAENVEPQKSKQENQSVPVETEPGQKEKTNQAAPESETSQSSINGETNQTPQKENMKSTPKMETSPADSKQEANSSDQEESNDQPSQKKGFIDPQY